MNYRFLLLILLCSTCFGYVSAEAVIQNGNSVTTSGQLTAITNTEGKEQDIIIPTDKLLFDVYPHTDLSGKVISLDVKLNHGLYDFYKEAGFPQRSQSVVFVYPIFTQAAYGNEGFYDYYNKKCDDRCLTVQIPHNFHGVYQSSIGGAFILRLLNYSYITDVDVDKDPDILKKYQTVVVLHNEYVTTKEFNAIVNHTHVLYLYPNSLYAQVIANYTGDTITLVRGHEFPSPDIRNGFGWKYDMSLYEYNVECDNWTFNQIGNGKMLNCYPDYRMLYDADLLKTIRDLSTQEVPEFGSLVGTIIAISILGVLVLSRKTRLRFF
jgi:hypothetical protein